MKSQRTERVATTSRHTYRCPKDLPGSRTALHDPRWPAVAMALKSLHEEGRFSIRIVDADCGAGSLLIHAAHHARAMGYTAVEARGIDGSPALIGRARAAGGKHSALFVPIFVRSAGEQATDRGLSRFAIKRQRSAFEYNPGHQGVNEAGHRVGCEHERCIDDMDIPACYRSARVAQHCAHGRLGKAQIIRQAGKTVTQHMRCDVGELRAVKDRFPFLLKHVVDRRIRSAREHQPGWLFGLCAIDGVEGTQPGRSDRGAFLLSSSARQLGSSSTSLYLSSTISLRRQPVSVSR